MRVYFEKFGPVLDAVVMKQWISGLSRCDLHLIQYPPFLPI